MQIQSFEKLRKKNTRKACDMLIISLIYISGLSDKTYFPYSYEPGLFYRKCHIWYWVYLINVHDTYQTTQKSMNAYWLDAENPKYRALNNHFNQLGYDQFLNMICRKFVSSRTFTIILTTLNLVHRTKPNRGLFWIKELGTAMLYGCHHNFEGIGN